MKIGRVILNAPRVCNHRFRTADKDNPSYPRNNRPHFPSETRFRKKPIGTRHARGQLPEERDSRVNVIALAVSRDEQAALQRGLARIAHGEKGDVMLLVPTARKIRAALLNPAGKICGLNHVGAIEGRMVRHKGLHRRSFVRHAQGGHRTLNREWKGSELLGPQAGWAVVLSDHRATGLHVSQESGKIRSQIGALVEGAPRQSRPHPDRAVFTRGKIGTGQRGDGIASSRAPRRCRRRFPAGIRR